MRIVPVSGVCGGENIVFSCGQQSDHLFGTENYGCVSSAGMEPMVLHGHIYSCSFDSNIYFEVRGTW